MTTITRSLVALAAVVFFATPALAGPPLICHPFETESGKLIAWGTGSGWNTPDRSYDIKKLVADTNAVLTADAPILTRMENMRRATIYAMRDPRDRAGAAEDRDGARAGHDQRQPRVVRRRLPDRVLQAGRAPARGSQARAARLGRGRRDDSRRRLQLGQESDVDDGAERGDGIRRVADDAGLGRVGASRQGACRGAEGLAASRRTYLVGDSCFKQSEKEKGRRASGAPALRF